ncbi:MAG: hypothetical protein EOO85_28830, partial [Pedobacter sp.]
MGEERQPRIDLFKQTKAFWETSQEKGGLKTSSTAVYFALLHRNNIHRWVEEFTVDYEVIMNLTKISKNTYYDCLKELVDKGFITHQRSANRALLGKISIVVLSSSIEAEALAEAVQVATATQLPPILEEPNITPEEINDDAGSSVDLFGITPPPKKKAVVEEYTFEEFWNTYPIKVGKKDSVLKWKSISQLSKLKIKETLNDFINHKPFERYSLPHPKTYLNTERWNDVIPRKAASSTQQQNRGFGAKPAGAVLHATYDQQ